MSFHIITWYFLCCYVNGSLVFDYFLNVVQVVPLKEEVGHYDVTKVHICFYLYWFIT